MTAGIRFVRPDVGTEAAALTAAGWELQPGGTNHVHVYCPACGTRVIGLPSTPSRSGRWRVRVRTKTRTHASRCWVDAEEE